MKLSSMWRYQRGLNQPCWEFKGEQEELVAAKAIIKNPSTTSFCVSLCYSQHLHLISLSLNGHRHVYIEK